MNLPDQNDLALCLSRNWKAGLEEEVAKAPGFGVFLNMTHLFSWPIASRGRDFASQLVAMRQARAAMTRVLVLLVAFFAVMCTRAQTVLVADNFDTDSGGLSGNNNVTPVGDEPWIGNSIQVIAPPYASGQVAADYTGNGNVGDVVPLPVLNSGVINLNISLFMSSAGYSVQQGPVYIGFSTAAAGTLNNGNAGSFQNGNALNLRINEQGVGALQLNGSDIAGTGFTATGFTPDQENTVSLSYNTATLQVSLSVAGTQVSSTVLGSPVTLTYAGFSEFYGVGFNTSGGYGEATAFDNFQVTQTSTLSNVPPVLPAQANINAAPLALLTVTNTASDASANPVILSYALVNPPAGAVISTNGIITWTPAETQNGGSYTVTTVVSDNNQPPLSATNSFTVTVTNGLPPGSGLIYSFDSAQLDTIAPSVNHGDPIFVGSYDGNGGRFWAEFTFQLPNLGSQNNPFISADFSLDVVGTQNNNSYGNQVTPLVGLTSNGIPLLRSAGTILPNDCTNSSTALDLSISYTAQTTLGIYSDSGPNLLNYLNAAYAGGAGAGQYVVLQLQAAGGLIYYKGFSVADNTYATLADQPQILFTAHNLNYTNSPPLLPSQTNIVVNELTPLAVTNTATDTNPPPIVLTYSLLNPPSGATIDANGIIHWIPSDSQALGTYTLTTVVSDNSQVPVTATNSFQVTVNEINVPPTLPAQYSRAVAPGAIIQVINTGTEADSHSQGLTYALINPPAGATIDSNGIITWTPAYAQDYSTNTLTTVVSDNCPLASNATSLSATNSFTVIVTDMSTGNLLTENPSFENVGAGFGNGPYAFDGWNGYNYRYGGNYVTAGGTQGTNMFHIDFGGQIETAQVNEPTVVPGATYQLTFDLETPFQDGNAGLLGTYGYLQFLDISNNLLKQYWGPDWRPWSQEFTTYPWQTITITGIAPPGAVYAQALVISPSGAYPDEDSRSINLDNFTLTRIVAPLDRIGVRRAPLLVQPGGSVTLAIKASTIGLRYLAVRLLDTNGNPQASVSQAVSPGYSLNYVSVPIPQSLPKGNYMWQIELLTQPTSFAQPVASKTVGGVFCDQTVELPSGTASTFPPTDTNLVFMGRCDTSNTNSYWVYWHGSEVRLRFSGTSLTLVGGCGDNGYGGPNPDEIYVLIDAPDNYTNSSFGTNYLDLFISSEQGSFPLVTNLSPGIHTARIIKADETSSQFHVDGFTVDSGCGLLRPEPLPNRRLEIYGDSVTSGSTASPNYLGYSTLVGYELGTDTHVISKGGTGVAASFSGEDILLNYYNNLSFPDAFNASVGTKWNFSQWIADAVMIAIGHNDQFNGGTVNFATNYWQLSADLRGYYPNAPILSVNTLISAPIGMFDSAITPICNYDTNHFFAMQLNPWTDPSTGHPPTAGHLAMVYGDSNVFSYADYIEEKCGWDLNAPLSGYEQWVTNQFSPAEIAQGLQSPYASVGTGSGANLLRYALGQPAHGVLSPTSRPQAGFDGNGHFTFSFYRAAADVNYAVQTSDDLVNWHVVATNPGSVGSTVRFTDQTLPLVNRRFARLVVSPNW